MNKKEIELLKVIKRDVELLEIDKSLNDNKYYYDLINGNLTDLINKLKEEEKIKCLMLDCYGVWGKVELLKNDFKFKFKYSKNIEIWEGENNDLFILKDIVR